MDRKPPVILFAVSDIATARSLRLELRRRGTVVLMADEAAAALRLARERRPDLAVLDADLGADVAGAFRQHGVEVPLVVLDSEPSRTSRRPAPGLTYYVSRSAALDNLLQTMASAFPGDLLTPPYPTGSPGKVLCVDDDSAFLPSLERLLARHGYEVFACESSPKALDLLPRVRPDVAILDVMMPGMDGLELAEEIRRRDGGRIPVVLLTALDSDEVFYEGHRRGARYLLTKPCDPGRILDVVDCLAGDIEPSEREVLKARL